MDSTEPPAPSLLSAGFHLRFFPALLKSRFGNQVAASRTTFVAATFMRAVLTLFFAGAAAFVGATLYPGITGWVLLGLAAVGIVHVLVTSILEARGIRPSYESFLFPLFFFCLALGLAAGAMFGLGQSTTIRLLYGSAGLALGYWVGLLIGLHGQRLGFIAILLYPFAIAGAAGVLLVAILFLST